MATRILAALGATLAAGLLATTAFAQSGASGRFVIHNDTEGNVVTGFYTNDGSGWSDNWLNGELQPGQSAPAEFHAMTGPCEQTFQVGWAGTDGGEVLDDPFDINICEAENVYLGDNEITFD